MSEGMRSLPTIALRTRAPRQGPELDLVNVVLRSGLPSKGRLQPVVFQEPEMPTGFPDIVAVYAARELAGWSDARLAFSNRHIRVLHHLYLSGGNSIAQLAEHLGSTGKHMRLLVDDLNNACVVNLRGDYVTSRSLSQIFSARRIVAIEAKIDDWRRAIEQAIGNTWFASHSYILMPAHSRMKFVQEEARAFGVGVLIFDGEEAQVLLEAKENPIPASYGSWLLNEWSVHRLRCGDGDD